MENLMNELKVLYKKPDEEIIKDISDKLKTAAKAKESSFKIYNVDSLVCEYFRGLGFMVDSYWDRAMDCQCAVFSGWSL